MQTSNTRALPEHRRRMVRMLAIARSEIRNARDVAIAGPDPLMLDAIEAVLARLDGAFATLYGVPTAAPAAGPETTERGGT